VRTLLGKLVRGLALADVAPANVSTWLAAHRPPDNAGQHDRVLIVLPDDPHAMARVSLPSARATHPSVHLAVFSVDPVHSSRRTQRAGLRVLPSPPSLREVASLISAVAASPARSAAVRAPSHECGEGSGVREGSASGRSTGQPSRRQSRSSSRPRSRSRTRSQSRTLSNSQVRSRSQQRPTVAPGSSGRVRAPSREVRNDHTVGTVQLSFLVVDDVQAIVQVMRVLLTSLGHSVLTAVNGRDAVDIFVTQAGSIDVVLMDCEMPVMGGFAAARAMRSAETAWLRDGDRVGVTIATTSANSLCNDDAEVENAGVDVFIAKPVRRSDIERLIAFRRQLMRQR